MGRPNLPSDLAQPAFDEFVNEFGIEMADELASILNTYVSFKRDAIEEMVDTTVELVFQAFPEAMGLWRGKTDEALTSDDLWPFQGTVSEGGAISWDNLERFVASTLARFTGASGLDFGDALLIGLDGEAVTGPRIGAWSQSGAIYLDLTKTDLVSDAVRELLARGWERFGNDARSFFKEPGRTGDADQVAAEVIWILRDLAALPSTGDLPLWGRGPAGMAAQELGVEVLWQSRVRE